MARHRSICFQVGQLAEARTFVEGYRGAWFRCKIKEVTRKKGQITYAVDYYDYPDDDEESIQMYDLPPKTSSSVKAKRELMLRPEFPKICREGELPEVNTISEVIVAVADVWKVGDFVDWFHDGCFWSGTVTEMIDDDMVKVTLPEPPTGEGSSYVVSCKDLRPSLNWSPEFGWTVPASLESQNGHPYARLIQPLKQAPLHNSLVDRDKQNVNVMPKSSIEVNESTSSLTSASSLPLPNRLMHCKDSLQQSEEISKKEMQQKHGVNMELDIGAGGSAIGKPSCSESVSSTYVRDGSAEFPSVTCVEERDGENGSSKKTRLNETIPLNSSTCDSIESAILDLEELVNRVKWLKQILKFGIPTTRGPIWEFLEHPAVSTTK